MKYPNLTSKFKNQINNGNLLYALIICLLVFTIFPFIYIIQYNLPGASDDMLNASLFKHLSYFSSVLEWYNTGYNGRFANSVLILLPERPYMNILFAKIIPYTYFLFLFLTIIFLIRTINKQIKIKNVILISLSFISFFICFIPSIYEMYWFSGSSVYIIPAILFILLLGMLIRFFNKTNNPFILIAFLLILFFTIGSHETWMLFSFLIISGFLIFELINKRKIKISAYIIIAWTIILTFIFILAPGNANRLNNESFSFDNANFWGSSVMSVFESINLIANWFLKFGFVFIIASILTYPVKINLNKEYRKKIQFPLIAIFVTVYASVFILLYSLGHFTYPLRYRGVIPGFTISLILFSYILLNLPQVFPINKSFKNINLSYTFLFLGIVFNISSSENLKNVYTDLLTNRAKIESKQVEWASNFILNSEKEIMCMPNINKGTKTLYFLEIPKESSSWTAWAIKSYTNTYVYLDNSLEFDSFKFSHDSTTLVNMRINSKDEFKYTYEYFIKDIINNKFTELKIFAILEDYENIDPENKILLVIECGDFWKAFTINDLKAIDNNGIFKTSQTIEQNVFTADLLKIYFWNTNEDTLSINRFKIIFE